MLNLFALRLARSRSCEHIRYVYGFRAIASIILLIACINYINLATAKAADRAKEVGFVKLWGQSKSMGTISSLFASLAIVIACLGLFGLVAFAASQKTKEIGIR